ncbi:MAG: hypothetical protein OYH77_00365 [Pseudomonadota bacterium]|nr:hypothetical protein [Pseudomonadota bacterium]
MKVLGCGVLVVALVGCMPPQENSGKVKSFDASACVDWDNLNKDYEADLSVINVYGMNQASNSAGDLNKDKSRTAQLAVLTLSSTDRAYQSDQDEDGGDKNAASVSKPSRLRVEDVFIKQIGSDKPAWDLKGLTDVNTPRSYQGPDPLQNLDLAVIMHIKAMINAQEKLSKIDMDKGILKKHIQEELKRGTNMAHYAGISTDHEGTSEVHLIMGRGVPTLHETREQEGAAAKDKYLDEEELDKEYSSQIVSPALLTLFHNGNTYMSDFPAAEMRSEHLDEVETLMPGMLNKLAGKYFFGAACGEDGGNVDPNANGK